MGATVPCTVPRPEGHELKPVPSTKRADGTGLTVPRPRWGGPTDQHWGPTVPTEQHRDQGCNTHRRGDGTGETVPRPGCTVPTERYRDQGCIYPQKGRGYRWSGTETYVVPCKAPRRSAGTEKTGTETGAGRVRRRLKRCRHRWKRYRDLLHTWATRGGEQSSTQWQGDWRSLDNQPKHTVTGGIGEKLGDQPRHNTT